MTPRIPLICLLLVAFTAGHAADNSTLRQELEDILALDQTHRGANRSAPWDDVAAEQAAIDQANLAKVERLLRSHEWPRRSQVGDDAALAAFLVIQHADVATQERYLPIIQARVAEGEAKPAWLALLTDRILVAKGKPQVYGTQSRVNPKTGVTEAVEIRDPRRVNERRALLGLKPLKRLPANAH
jgi:hypothetical protein